MSQKVQRVASHWRSLSVVFVASVVIATVGYHAFEAYSWVQCFEWAVQTVTSTGYGDLPAKTAAGALWAAGMMIWGVGVILSLITALIVNTLRHDPNVFTDAEQNEILSYIREQRAKENSND